MTETVSEQMIWTTADWGEATTTVRYVNRLLAGAVQAQLSLTPNDPSVKVLEAQLTDVRDTLHSFMAEQRRLLDERGLSEPPL